MLTPALNNGKFSQSSHIERAKQIDTHRSQKASESEGKSGNF